MKIIWAAALAFCALTSAAHADEKINCKSQDLNQMQLDQCAGQDFTKSDAKLNRLYRDMLGRYDAANGAKFKAAERAWIAWRDAECDYETNGTAGGTINSMMFTMCKTSKSDARIQELTAQLKCPEGDLSCNAPN